LNVWPKRVSTFDTVYLALFVAFTATTVGTAGQTSTSYVEPDFTAYARQSIASGAWGSPAAGTGGRAVAATQQTFATATGNSTSTTNGFCLHSSTAALGTTVCVFAANFDDDTGVKIMTNDVIKVTPTVQYNN
jgi:hypothetical protein